MGKKIQSSRKRRKTKQELQNQPKYEFDEFIRRVTLLRVIDGDTIDVDIDQGWGDRSQRRLRLLNVNTPEKRGVSRELGEAYKWLTEFWIRENSLHREDGRIQFWIRSEDYDLGKFGRTLAEVISWDGESTLNDYLNGYLNAGWAGEMQNDSNQPESSG